MQKGDKISERRIEAAVKGFIEAEIALVMPTKVNELKTGCTTAFFRLQSLRKRLTNRLRAEKNGTFYLRSQEDMLITLKIGKHEKEFTEITIKNNDLCFKKV